MPLPGRAALGQGAAAPWGRAVGLCHGAVPWGCAVPLAGRVLPLCHHAGGPCFLADTATANGNIFAIHIN